MRSFGGTSSTYCVCTIDSTSVNSRSCSYVAPESVPLLATVPPSDSVNTTSNEPITNAFFMNISSCAAISAPLAEPLFWILGLALEADLEIQARSLERAGVSHRADPLSLLHVVALA